MLVSGKLKLESDIFVNDTDLFGVFDYDSIRNKIYAGYTGNNIIVNPDENLNPVIYRLNEDLTYDKNIDKLTFPQGYSIDTSPSGCILTDDGSALYMVCVLYDYIIGPPQFPSPDGTQTDHRIVKINIDHNNFSNSTIEFFDYFTTGTENFHPLFTYENYLYYLTSSDDLTSHGTLPLFRINILDGSIYEEYDSNFRTGGFSKAVYLGNSEFIMVRGYEDNGNELLSLIKYNVETKTLTESSNKINQRGIGQIFKTSLNRYEFVYASNQGVSSRIQKVIVDDNLNTYGEIIATDTSSYYNVNYETSPTNILKVNGLYYFGNDGITRLKVVQNGKSNAIFSGSNVSNEQVDKNIPILTAKPYLKQIFFKDTSDILINDDSIISNDQKNELIYVLNTSGNGGGSYIIKKLDYDFNLLDTFDTSLLRIRRSLPYISNNKIFLTAETGIYEIELDSILSNSSITQINTFNHNTFSVSNNVFTTEIFFINDDHIYLHSSTTSIDFDRYIKLDKNTGSILDSYDLTPVNNQIANYYFDENTYKLYHIRRRPNTNYKIFNFNKMSFDFDGTDNIPSIESTGLFYEKISDKIWKYFHINSNNKLELKTVNVTNTQEISKIEGKNNISSPGITGFEDKGILYNMYGGLDTRKFVLSSDMNNIEPVVMKDLLIEYDLSKEETYDIVNQELVNTNSNYPNGKLAKNPVYISGEKCMEFDGTNYGWLENIDYDRGEFTIEGYFLWTEVHTNYDSNIFSKWQTGAVDENEFIFGSRGNSGPLPLNVNTYDTNYIDRSIETSYNYVIDNYYYMQYRVKDSTARLYVDNVFIDSVDIVTDTINEAPNLAFGIACFGSFLSGNSPGSGTSYLTKCKIKAIRMYNRALTDSELSTNYTNTLKRHNII